MKKPAGRRLRSIAQLLLLLCFSLVFSIFQPSARLARVVMEEHSERGNTFSQEDHGDHDEKKAQDCDCWSNSTVLAEVSYPEQCCRRTIYYSHKMGSVLVQDLFGASSSGRRRTSSKGSNAPPPAMDGMVLRSNPPSQNQLVRENFFAPKPHRQHRDVVVIRNLVDSIISGYLYHKSGKECWLDKDGKQTRGQISNGLTHKTRMRYEELLSNNTKGHRLNNENEGGNKFPWEPSAGRTLCDYLEQEPESIGMRVYVEVALEQWYRSVYRFWELVHRSQQEKQHSLQQRVLFVCFEELANPDRQLAEFYRIMSWLFPNQTYDGRYNPAVIMEDYQGGHATSHDPELRGRLKRIIRRLDEGLLDKWISKANQAMGCGRAEEDEQSPSEQRSLTDLLMDTTM